MLPITGVPGTIARGMAEFRNRFCRAEGFEHVSRSVTRLILSPNKTLQGIYHLQVWGHNTPSRRAMHAAVFEAAWDSQVLIQRHRATVAPDHRGLGCEVISLDGRWRIMREALTSLASTWRMMMCRSARRGFKPSSPR